MLTLWPWSNKASQMCLFPSLIIRLKVAQIFNSLLGRLSEWGKKMLFGLCTGRPNLKELWRSLNSVFICQIYFITSHFDNLLSFIILLSQHQKHESKISLYSNLENGLKPVLFLLKFVFSVNISISKSTFQEKNIYTIFILRM